MRSSVLFIFLMGIAMTLSSFAVNASAGELPPGTTLPRKLARLNNGTAHQINRPLPDGSVSGDKDVQQAVLGHGKASIGNVDVDDDDNDHDDYDDDYDDDDDDDDDCDDGDDEDDDDDGDNDYGHGKCYRRHHGQRGKDGDDSDASNMERKLSQDNIPKKKST